MTIMTGWQAVVRALKAEGIKYVYGMPSSPSDLYDALYDILGPEKVINYLMSHPLRQFK